jgi:hypothetical protein
MISFKDKDPFELLYLRVLSSKYNQLIAQKIELKLSLKKFQYDIIVHCEENETKHHIIDFQLESEEFIYEVVKWLEEHKFFFELIWKTVPEYQGNQKLNKLD